MAEEAAGSLLIRARRLDAEAAGSPVLVRPSAEALVAEARAAGDVEALVTALRALAQCHRAVLGHAAAVPLLDEAVRRAQRAGSPTLLGEVLASRGALRHELGRPRSARRDLDRASRLLAGRSAREVDLQRAALAHNAGRLAEARALYLALLRRGGLTDDVRARAANNLGLVESSLGRHASAAGWLEVAAAAAARVGPAYVALVAESRAAATVRAGRLAEGLDRFDRAAELWRRADLPLGELYAEYADALAELRLLPEALEHARRAASMLEGRQVPLMAAEARLRVARLALDAGDPGTSAEVADEAAESMRRQQRADWRARAVVVRVRARAVAGLCGPDDRGELLRAAATLHASGAPAEAAEAYLAAGRLAEAQGRADLAVADYRQARAVSPAAPLLARARRSLAAALAARAAGDDDAMLRACRSGLGDLARHRSALASSELRALAAGHGAELAALGLGVLVRRGASAPVLAWMERTRSNALAPAVLEGPPTSGPAGRDAAGDGTRPGPTDELSALRAVQVEIDAARASTGLEPPALTARRDEIEQAVRRRAWSRGRPPSRRARGTAPGRPSLAALREALGGRVLVAYDVLDGGLLAAVVEPRRVRLVGLGRLATVVQDVETLRQALHGLVVGAERLAAPLHVVARAATGRLTAALVDPLALTSPRGVVVVPVGALQRAPWSAMLPCPVSVAPSAALWLHTAQPRPAPGEGTVLAAGPGLAGAVEEVEALAAVHPAARVLVPPHSRADAVRAAMDGAALVHLACHGRVRADNPTFSSLQLADGPLTLHELEDGITAPDRLVLAACDVGGGIAFPGNEALGFVGTLLAAGCRGVVASPTLVADHHVRPLVLALHRHLATAAAPLDEALHAARLALDGEDPRSYPAWCSFTAYGAG